MTAATDPLNASVEAPVLVRVRALRWQVLDGPQRGAELPVDGDHTTIGTAADNTLMLKDSTVSGHHAVVLSVAEGFLVRDLGSKNGTFVRGARVREGFLKPGDHLRCGRTTVTFEPLSDSLPVAPEREHRFGALLGSSLAMRQFFGILRRVSRTEMTVVFWGQTGSGKDVAARTLHAASRRAAGPFVVLDCAALDRELVSSELFGHEVGAFTGATAPRPGAFELASGGTLFIDEIGELPLELQPKLLQALERREVKRLGGIKPIRIDCRILAATHRDLPRMVRAGEFRTDLYYRLAQVVVRIPSLKERREDIPYLVEHFLRNVESVDTAGPLRFTPAALSRLVRGDYPGNVRELRNLVERASAMADGPEITEADLFTPGFPEEEAVHVEGTLESMEKRAIEQSLLRHQYHRRKVAQELGIGETSLRDKIRRYGIPVPEKGQ